MSIFAISGWVMFILLVVFTVAAVVLYLVRKYYTYAHKTVIRSQAKSKDAARRELLRLEADHIRVGHSIALNEKKLKALGVDEWDKGKPYHFEREGLVYVINQQREKLLCIEHWQAEEMAIIQPVGQKHVTN